MRFVPNRLKVSVEERTPVAFVRIGSHIGLIDNTGHVMEIPAHNKTQYSFPVIAGTRDTEPLSTRAARMKVYNELVRELDSEGGHYSSELSEVDLTDPEDTRVLVSDPSGDVLLHLGSVSTGSGNYLDRVKLYHAHVAEWRQQFEKLDSVDLRYERQIVVNPDLRSTPQPVSLSPAAAKAAVTAGVPAVAMTAAALVKRQQAVAKPLLVAAKTTTKIPAKTANLQTPILKKTILKKTILKKTILKAPIPSATPHGTRTVVKIHQGAKKAAKKAAHKRAKTSERVAKKLPASVSAAKTVKHASAKTTARALAPAKPHQLPDPTKSSNKGKPHAAIVNP
jgi:hypothetical protein